MALVVAERREIDEVDSGGHLDASRQSPAVEQRDIEVLGQAVAQGKRPHEMPKAERVLAVEEEAGPAHAATSAFASATSSSSRASTGGRTRFTARTACSVSSAAAV